MFSKYAESVQGLLQPSRAVSSPHIINEYPRLLEEKHIERMEDSVAGQFNYISSEYIVPGGLVLLALDQDAARAQLIFDCAARAAAKVYEGT